MASTKPRIRTDAVGQRVLSGAGVTPGKLAFSVVMDEMFPPSAPEARPKPTPAPRKKKRGRR